MAWQQQKDKPLFEDLIWGRPENRRHAGKLLIIGGQAGEFSHVAQAYESAQKARAGYIKVLLPESLQKIAQALPDVEFGPANKSGSFAKNALAEWFDLAGWADHVLLAGDFGKNSETTTILDGFLLRGISPLSINLNSISSIGIDLKQLVNFPITLVIDRPLLQKIGMMLELSVPIKSTTPIAQLVEIIEQISLTNKANFVIQDNEQTWVAVGGNVVSSKSREGDNTKLSAACAVWQMQNPSKPLQALATAIYELK